MWKGVGLVISARRKAIKGWVKKFLDKARAGIREHKFKAEKGKRETQEQGRERTHKLAIAQARFNAIREMYEEL